MAGLEHFIHGTPDGAHSLPVLVRAALAHVQFETIHPFLDGTGRLGRLLSVLMLIDARVLQQPLLYLSLFFKQHRSRYYELLNGVRLKRDWEAWIDFFLEGVESTATAAVTTAHRLLALFRTDEAKLSGLGRSGPSVRQVFAALCRRPLNSIGQLSAACGLSFPTTSKSLEALVKLGIARGDHWRPAQSPLCLRRLSGDPQRRRRAALPPGLDGVQPGRWRFRSGGELKGVVREVDLGETASGPKQPDG